MSEDIRSFMGHLWVSKEAGLITIGISEEALEDFSEVTSLDLPSEGERVEADEVCGSVETDDGPLDIYSPEDGVVSEVNLAVIDDPSLIQEDPTGDGWLIRIESEGSDDDLDEDEDEDDDDFDEDGDED